MSGARHLETVVGLARRDACSGSVGLDPNADIIRNR